MRRIELASVAVALVLLAGCGGGVTGGGAGAAATAANRCGTDTEEPLDPGSVQHLLPGAPEPTYSSDPPTSGPHLAGGAPLGAQDHPVSRPAQVALLEKGGVMLQYRHLPAGDLRRLRSLAERQVVVAPNPGLATAVVATAWRHRLTCGGAASGAVQALAMFVDTYKGKGPEQ